MRRSFRIFQLLLLFLLVCNSLLVFSQSSYLYTDSFRLEPGEKWYGAAVNEGHKMPFQAGYSADLYGNNFGNQTSPILLSTTGRYIWSEQPFAFSFGSSHVKLAGMDSLVVRKAGSSLREAYREASRRHFPATGTMPDLLLFERPQYNTWIELIYNQNQEDILKYAHAIVDNGFPTGVLMIDDNWAPYYGRFEFRKDRFPDAKAMMAELHQLGFKVMVWVCPFIRPDSEEFRELFKSKAVLMDNKGDTSLTWANATEAAIIRWWNGYSAELDFSNPKAVDWFTGQLKKMQQEYGVDGFKLDAGDMEYYSPHSIAYKKITPNEHAELWGRLGLLFPLNEYRAMWKMGGQPLAERLRDKAHNWEDLQTLVPNMTAAGLLGYAFTCPDMIGGGEFSSFIDDKKLDQELIVRSAQCHALMPMMQFSVAPWRILDSANFAAVKKSVALRQRFTPYILQLAKSAAQTGEPIIRNMEYMFPRQGFAENADQFMLGDKYLVAPMVTKGSKRTVVFPKGRWKGEDGKLVKGPIKKDYTVPFDQLLWFELVK